MKSTLQFIYSIFHIRMTFRWMQRKLWRNIGWESVRATRIFLFLYFGAAYNLRVIFRILFDDAGRREYAFSVDVHFQNIFQMSYNGI